MNMREARFVRGYSQWQMSRILWIPQSRISLIERGLVDPRDDEKEKIAKLLGFDENVLFPEYGDPTLPIRQF